MFDRKAYDRQRSKSPHRKAAAKARREKPENKERKRQYDERYRQTNHSRLMEYEHLRAVNPHRVAYRKEYRQKNHEPIRTYDRAYKKDEKHHEAALRYNREPKRIVLNHYSRGQIKCSCCGESIMSMLTIDHREGGGSAHRRSLGISAGHHFYLWLIKNGFPEGYQVMCWNCNWGRRIEGECPHARDTGTATSATHVFD